MPAGGNKLIITGGYHWVVVPLESREQYMRALEKASVEEEIGDFVNFVLSLIQAHREF